MQTPTEVLNIGADLANDELVDCACLVSTDTTDRFRERRWPVSTDPDIARAESGN